MHKQRNNMLHKLYSLCGGAKTEEEEEEDDYGDEKRGCEG